MQQHLRAITLLLTILSSVQSATFEPRRPTLEPKTILEGSTLSPKPITQKDTIDPSTLCVCNSNFEVDCAGDANCPSDCNSKARYAEEVDCVFPFQYKGVWYDTCTNADRPFYWCSLNTVYTDKFAPCKAKCPLLAKYLMGSKTQTHSSCLEMAADVIVHYPTDADEQAIIDRHNLIRSEVTDATNMRKVYWDRFLSRTVTKFSGFLVGSNQFKHDCGECRQPMNGGWLPVGQNLFMMSGVKNFSSDFWQSMLDAW
jgi:hypothetical protein